MNALHGIPEQIIEVMLERQFEQTGKKDRSVFEKRKGFNWIKTIEEEKNCGFWSQVLINKNFDKFYELYPKIYTLEEFRKGEVAVQVEYKQELNELLSYTLKKEVNYNNFYKYYYIYHETILATDNLKNLPVQDVKLFLKQIKSIKMTKKEFALEQIKEYVLDPSKCGFNKKTLKCQNLTSDGKMCVAGKNYLPDVRKKWKDNGVSYILTQYNNNQSFVFKKEVVGILNLSEWCWLQSMHDSIARESVLLTDFENESLFSYEEMMALKNES